jgi:hypothetical protein
MSKSILKNILDFPVDKLVRIGRPLPNREALRLYREILKFSSEFDWKNERGQHWKSVLRASARKEFDLARDERDPMLILKMIVTSREAISESRIRMSSQVHRIN